MISAAKTEKESPHKANEAIVASLEKRGPNALDVLIESLEAEEDVNKHIILKIREGNHYVACLSIIIFHFLLEFKQALPPRCKFNAVIKCEMNTANVSIARPIAVRKSIDEKETTAFPTDGTDRPNQPVYKMSSKPRGLGKLLICF